MNFKVPRTIMQVLSDIQHQAKEKSMRKAVGSREKREEIIQAAQECFFLRGYDGTSVRAIMKRVGAEVGLFYYYFDSKDDVFEYALDYFFEQYRKEFEKIANEAKRCPLGALQHFFHYMIAETRKFRVQYKDKLHRTVSWAIREHTLTLIMPYIRQIVEILLQIGAELPASVDVTAMLLTHGVGSLIIHEENEWININVADVQRAANLIMGLEPESYELTVPIAAKREDLPAIKEILELLSQKSMKKQPFVSEETLLDKIEKQELLVVKHYGSVLGCLGFNRQSGEIEFVTVAEVCRDERLAERLLMVAFAEFPVGSILKTALPCEKGEREAGLLEIYRRFGFVDTEKITEGNDSMQWMEAVVTDCVPMLCKRGDESKL